MIETPEATQPSATATQEGDSPETKPTQEDHTNEQLQEKRLLGRRQWFYRISFAILTTVFALLVAENVVAGVAPQPVAYSTPQLNRGAFTTPGKYRHSTDEFDVVVNVNRHGFVDREWNARWMDQKRILLLGDSFVQAAQVDLDKGLGRQLEKTLQQMSIESEVLSLGVPGAGTATQLLLLQKYVDELEPDEVILCFLVANDVLNNHPSLELKTDKPFLVPDPTNPDKLTIFQSNAPADKNWLWDNSHLSRWMTRRLQFQEMVRQKTEQGDGVPIDYHVHNDQLDPTWEEAWQLTNHITSEMAALLKQKSIDFRIVLIPALEQINKKSALEIKQAYSETIRWDFVTYAQRRALATMSQYGPVLNLQDSLSMHPNPETLYYLKDRHWTEEGHATAAKILAGWLSHDPYDAVTDPRPPPKPIGDEITSDQLYKEATRKDTPESTQNPSEFEIQKWN